MNGRRTLFSRYGVVHHFDESGPLVWSWHIYYHSAVRAAEHLNRVRRNHEVTARLHDTGPTTVAYVDTVTHIDQERNDHAR